MREVYSVMQNYYRGINARYLVNTVMSWERHKVLCKTITGELMLVT